MKSRIDPGPEFQRLAELGRFRRRRAAWRKRFMQALVAILLLSPVAAAQDQTGDLQKATQNPVASLISVPLQKDMHRLLQFGLVGYGQWQTSNNSGPGVSPALPAYYRVNAVGGAANIILPTSKASAGFKLFKEFSNSSTVQGYSFQVTGAITF